MTKVSPWQFKALLGNYAEYQVRSARSHLGDHPSGVAGSFILTVGIIVSRTPAAYRIKGESILNRWCDARRLEASILDEIAATRSKRNSTTKANTFDACTKKLKDLDRALRIATEQTCRIEDNPHFDAALDWAAADLSRRLDAVSVFELRVWEVVVGVLLTA